MNVSSWGQFVADRAVGRTLAAVLLLGALSGGTPITAQNNGPASSNDALVVDSFEDYEPGTFPDGWVFVESKDEIHTYEETKGPGREVSVQEEDGNRFVRLITKNDYLRYSKRNGVDFDWNLEKRPQLAWRWRALTLPEGASEKGQNDVGGALYVTFGTDWLGRPKSIKYTYSSSLPVGTVVSHGPLRVIVVDSAVGPRMGEWKTVQRNVVNDYRQVFGGEPPDRPVSITLWSDSDTTGDESKADFDDIKLIPSR